MLQINNKTLVCLLVSFLLVVSAGSAGVVVGASSQKIFPSSWLKYLPKINFNSSKIITPSEFEKKPVKTIYLSVEGKIKTISSTALAIESEGEAVSLKLDQKVQPYRFTSLTGDQSTVSGSQPAIITPPKLSWEQIKVGNQVSVTAILRNNELVVTSFTLFGE